MVALIVQLEVSCDCVFLISLQVVQKAGKERQALAEKLREARTKLGHETVRRRAPCYCCVAS